MFRTNNGKIRVNQRKEHTTLQFIGEVIVVKEITGEVEREFPAEI